MKKKRKLNKKIKKILFNRVSLYLILALVGFIFTINMNKIETKETEKELSEVAMYYQTRVESNKELVLAEDITEYTDLSVINTITSEDINTIIDYWNSLSDIEIAFVGEGQTFIDASKYTGLDPVYILAHAALESAWGTSDMAISKHNYFGIGAVDHDPDNSYIMGNDQYQGIVDGAIWIRENYYDAGQTSLYSMRYNNGINEYCTSDTWVYEILDIIQTSYSLLQQS